MEIKLKSLKPVIEENEERRLLEMSIAGWGDWEPKRDRVASKTFRSLEADYEKKDVLDIYGGIFDLYQHKSKPWFLLGRPNDSKDDKSFEVLFKIEFTKRTDLESHIPYKNIMNVDGVITKESLRGSKLGRYMYQYFVKKLKYTILGDEIQYHKARLLWTRLSKLDTVKVDIVDIDSGKVIEKDVKLYHGEADYEFDERVWDYSDIKKHIRLVLIDVK